MATQESTADERKPSLVVRLHAQRERHEHRPMAVRVLYVIAGFAVLAAGCVMLVTPGPALAVIPIGLGILSLEFAWAERLLDRAILAAEEAARKAEESTTQQRIVSGVLVALACAGIVVWALLGDIPLVPFI